MAQKNISSAKTNAKGNAKANGKPNGKGGANAQKQSKVQAAPEEPAFRPNIARIIFGVIVGYLVPLISVFIVVFAAAFYHGYIATARWLDWIIIVLLLLIAIAAPFYFYGWLHRSLALYGEGADWWVKIPGKFFGGVGYVLQPIVLLTYGPNKKWLYFFTVGIPSLLGGLVFLLNYLNVLVFDVSFSLSEMPISLHAYSLPLAIALFLNGFLALLTKRCKHCGCMMTEIVHSVEDIEFREYEHSGDYTGMGDKITVGKFYVCEHCLSVKKGIGFSVQTDKIVV